MEKNIEENSKNRQKLDKVFKRVFPYAIIATLASGYTLGSIKAGSKNYLVARKTVDSFGNEKIYTEYDNSYTINPGKVTHISKWNLNENNEYERTTKVYDISRLKPETAQNIVLNEKSIKSLEEMFGNPAFAEKEIGKNLSEEELNRPEYLEAVTYSKDQNDYIVTKLSTGELIETAALSLTYFIMGSLIFGGIRIAKEQDYKKFTESPEDAFIEVSEKTKVKTLKKTL